MAETLPKKDVSALQAAQDVCEWLKKSRDRITSETAERCWEDLQALIENAELPNK